MIQHTSDSKSLSLPLYCGAYMPGTHTFFSKRLGKVYDVRGLVHMQSMHAWTDIT